MTYVVGVRNADVGVLICDTRVSFGPRKSEGFNYSLKSGLLFPGCLYAGSGYTSPMRKFIARFKRRVNAGATWETFLDFAAEYTEYESAYSFQLLLMSRHSGASKFYLFESTTGTITEQPEFVTLGSGKEILDKHLSSFRNERNEMIMKHLREHDAPFWFFGYYYCLGLMELAQGDMYNNLNNHGVGGVFHFSYQDHQTEHRQHPAVYLVIRVIPERRTLLHTLYRVTFAQMALVVEDGSTQSFNISIDEAAWPPVAKLDLLGRAKLKKRLVNDALDQPFYNFLGAGFADEARRGNWVDHINYGNDEYLISRNTINSDMLKRFVEGMVDGSIQQHLRART